MVVIRKADAGMTYFGNVLKCYISSNERSPEKLSKRGSRYYMRYT